MNGFFFNRTRASLLQLVTDILVVLRKGSMNHIIINLTDVNIFVIFHLFDKFPKTENVKNGELSTVHVQE